MWTFYMDFLLWVVACRIAAGRLAPAFRRPEASAFLANFQLNYAPKAWGCQ